MTIVVTEISTPTTVVKLLTQALRDISALGKGETANADDIADSFALLKQMVGQWQVDGLMIYAQSAVSFAATGAQSYTVGTAGAVDTTRPAEVLSAFWRDTGGNDTRLDVLPSFDDYQRISPKALGATPEIVCYVPSYPLGVLHVWPQPSSGTLHLTLQGPLPTYLTITEDLSVPGEYELALRYSLAELLAPAFQLPLDVRIAKQAMRARKIIKRNNVRIPQLAMPAGLPMRRGYAITGGQ